MFNKRIIGLLGLILCFMMIAFVGCGEREKITDLSQLEGKVFAVPTGTVADQLVLSRFPDARFQYYNTVLDCCMAVKSGKADAAADDEPILKNIAAKNQGLKVLPDMITVDNYGFAVHPGNKELKVAIDEVIAELKNTGKYDEMLKRWIPEDGAPAAMPDITLTGDRGVLRFGTAAVTEPFSFVDGSQEIVGFDIELAKYIARHLGMQLEIVDMDFGGLIPALIAGKVDLIGACITITDERAKNVLFSEPYYTGGIAALVRE
ncbi:MAG TPA: transporter substrate-binding domain-containing protein [Bacillota bacterium]|jgi:polar amino acid transport system substrate-binding protein|nr:transporter substrate-binding domain-containing protein [Peptococcaceae bacterium MAG4]NLW37758.1 transporter substrate-binding domain-containing protein [Peptococcaceae bacterium]HPZ44028.1 transporter substrate-binding domain-containing protein [Bacillota bacterium]HUM59259.1 transporter substrate-binding domain-containing protein [Bacillota bacterium]